ncbi:MAG: radical SAM family heme chaperone HemW [Ruminococcus sp.]|jgi:oxygen-independent coproporphyrinogen-3 oxidase|nr:radical SAM family heme chaperone HemW [Ruminococcus sp.]
MKKIGLYVHVPFCVRKCGYCDFYSITELSLIDDYVKAVIRNIKDYQYDTVYFGGGTPSMLTASQIGRIIEAASPVSDAEITIECNPQSSGGDYFRELRDTGVNRLSIGLQSFDDETLRKLGRLHDSQTAVQTVFEAHDAGYENISIDLMLGVSNIRPDFDTINNLPIKHVSAYILKIEDNTPFGNDKTLSFPDEDEVCDEYLETVKKLDFPQYEISNFAKIGYECKHNLKYWNCEEYFGIGPAAHSYLNGKRFAVLRDIKSFINSQLQPTYITDENPGGIDEKLMLGLRLTQKGINVADCKSENLQRYIDAGMLRRSENIITLTPRGALISNSIITDLLC